MAELNKKRTSWNKGLRNAEKRHKICFSCNNEFYCKYGQGISIWIKRKFCSHKCALRSNLLHSIKGQVPWNKGKTYKTGVSRLDIPKGEKNWSWKGGKPNCKDCGKKVSTYSTIRCRLCHDKQPQTKEHIINSLRKRAMSSLEIRVQKVIIKYNLPYKFVGNGDFFIERKNPDFININGDKKAIEVYSKRQKDEFRNGGFAGWKKERIEVFSKYGWDVLFIEAYQTNKEENILQILKGGY